MNDHLPLSASELVKCAAGALDSLAKEQYGARISARFWKKSSLRNGMDFRFGIDNEIGQLDPNLSEGALFSPLDVWKIVESLVTKQRVPSSQSMSTMKFEFEFMSFALRFTSTPDGFVDLFQNLDGGWWMLLT
jgi:hypothetical protein